MDEETAEALTRTKALYDAGVLTEEEYNAKKEELLHAPAVVVAQPPANEHGGVVQGHVVAVQPQKVHPEPRPGSEPAARRRRRRRGRPAGTEDILANYRSDEEASRAATRIQAEARRSAAWKDFPLPPGAISATSLQGWWFGPGPIGICCWGVAPGILLLPLGCPCWCFKFEARGHNRLMMTNLCGCDRHDGYSRERDSKNFKRNVFQHKGEGNPWMIIHNSICATHICGYHSVGRDVSGNPNGGVFCWGCITPLMCRIPGTVRTAWTDRYGSADVATTRNGVTGY
mmetsp:Transcript_10228/g.30044  ORF Transcript_10228/g.30044 Transcript_10228/m.30044 type:complete len:286 (+) Transcript_10228:191-1048(+)